MNCNSSQFIFDSNCCRRARVAWTNETDDIPHSGKFTGSEAKKVLRHFDELIDIAAIGDTDRTRKM